MKKLIFLSIIVLLMITGLVCQYNSTYSVLITDRIDIAIAEFVEEYGPVQHSISLPEKEFQELMDWANEVELGRMFTKNGLFYCTLPVTMNTGSEILILPEVIWE